VGRGSGTAMKDHQSASAPIVGGSIVEPTPAGRESDLTADLARLLALLDRGEVEEARAWVKELERRWPDAERVRHFARVLAPTQVSVRRGERGRSLEREHAWLRAHARDYPGCWLAIFEDRLIAANPDLNAVLAATREIPGAERALLHFQPGAPD